MIKPNKEASQDNYRKKILFKVLHSQIKSQVDMISMIQTKLQIYDNTYYVLKT